MKHIGCKILPRCCEFQPNVIQHIYNIWHICIYIHITYIHISNIGILTILWGAIASALASSLEKSGAGSSGEKSLGKTQIRHGKTLGSLLRWKMCASFCSTMQCSYQNHPRHCKMCLDLKLFQHEDKFECWSLLFRTSFRTRPMNGVVVLPRHSQWSASRSSENIW